MLLVPLAPHLGQTNPLVLPGTTVIDLALDSMHTAMLVSTASGIRLGGGGHSGTMSHRRFVRMPDSPA
jgi:hypothetical protein